jgi:predicted RNA-binding Zn-ribbon protein involved in translation (DUF1610 family)
MTTPRDISSEHPIQIVGEDVRLFCPRCGKEVAKIFAALYWRIKKDYEVFCVYHPECDGLKVGEILQFPSGAHLTVER